MFKKNSFNGHLVWERLLRGAKIALRHSPFMAMSHYVKIVVLQREKVTTHLAYIQILYISQYN